MSCFNHIIANSLFPNSITKCILFIWDNKPDKISREQMTTMNLHGGFTMVYTELFIKAQKIAWIQRFIDNPDAPCTKLFSAFSSTETKWSKNMGMKISNPFWCEVLLVWSNLLETNLLHKDETISCPLWYNPQISIEPLFLPHWYSTGIYSPMDLLDSNKRIFELDVIKEHFNIKTNFFEHIRIKRHIKHYLETWAGNVIFVTGKKYIFDCSCNKKTPNLNGFKAYTKTIYLDEQYISNVNYNNNSYFLTAWSTLATAIRAQLPLSLTCHSCLTPLIVYCNCNNMYDTFILSDAIMLPLTCSHGNTFITVHIVRQVYPSQVYLFLCVGYVYMFAK